MRPLLVPVLVLAIWCGLLCAALWAQEKKRDGAGAAGGAPAEGDREAGAAPTLSLDPTLPQVGGRVISPAEAAPAAPPPPTSAWRARVTGYLRAPLRLSWGPATTPAPDGRDPGTQLRTPPLVPDANSLDWRSTNRLAAPWTELNFHYGNSRVSATVQIASYNITDAGFRRLEANLGINQSFLTIVFPELFNAHSRLTLTAGGFTNRYGAAGRYDAGAYETYLFGRTHTAGETMTFEYDFASAPWALVVEHGFGAKLEPIPFYDSSIDKSWDPIPGPSAQESTFIHHLHLGVVINRTLLIGLHYIDAFANDNERAGSYMPPNFMRAAAVARPRMTIAGGELKLLGGALGDGYVGYARLDAVNADYLGDAVEVLHAQFGWQLHDNYFGAPGVAQRATGKIDSVLFQHVVSLGRLLRRPRVFRGDGPDLVASVFGMYNRVSGAVDPNANHARLKAGAELTYLPLPWVGLGARFDTVEPNLNDATQTFSVVSARILVRSAFLTHEQIVFQYSRYRYGANAAHGPFPYNGQGDQPNDLPNLGADKNAGQIVAIIWF